jgi:hypothetical protein
MGVRGDQGGGAGIILATDDFHDFPKLGPVVLLSAANNLSDDEIALCEISSVLRQEAKRLPRFPVYRLYSNLSNGFADDAQKAMRALP